MSDRSWRALNGAEKGGFGTLHELFKVLQQQSQENSYKIDLTEAINSMKQEAEIRISVDKA